MSAAERRTGGFITLHRAIEDWPLWLAMTAQQRMVVVILLLAANWRETTVVIEGHRVAVRRGQFIDSEEAIAKRAKVSRKVVRTTFAKLEVDGFLHRESGLHLGAEWAANGHEKGPHKGRYPNVTSIRNYDRFQRPVVDEGLHQGQQEACIGPASGLQGAPSEPVKPYEPDRSIDRGVTLGEPRAEDEAMAFLRRLSDSLALREPMQVGKLKPADTLAEMRAWLAQLGADSALEACREIAFEAKKRERRFPSSLSYFTACLRTRFGPLAEAQKRNWINAEGTGYVASES